MNRCPPFADHGMVDDLQTAALVAASAPVRAGNAAADQLQLDIYGEAADALAVGGDISAIRGCGGHSAL